MPPSEFTPPEFQGPGHEAGMGNAAPNVRVETQLSQPADVSQAHQFFQPRADAGLPSLNLGDGGAASLSTIPHGIMPGGEHALSALPMGAEKGLAMLAPTPGAEQISPLIQMMMKLPGLAGVIDNFFEFLKMCFEGNMIESLTSALMDPTGMLMHLFEEGGDSFTVSMDVMPNNMPIFKFENGMFSQPDASAMRLHTDLLDDANVGAPIANTNLEQAIFERTSNYTITDHHQQSLLDWHGQNNNISLGPESSAYRPTMGAYQAPPTTATPTTHSSSLSHQTNAPPSAHHGASHHSAHHAPHHAPKHHFKARDVAIDHTRIAQAQPTDAVNGQYTVQSGDSLWDIAKRNLGDGSRWGEIYKMNADVIGQNADLIHPGTTLQMPDGNSIASAAGDGSKYIVQPGDNLWSISQQHLGGGQNWNELFKMNQGVIGENPSLIHPGQELSLGGATDSLATAPVDAGAAASVANSAPTTSASPVSLAQSQPVQPMADATVQYQGQQLNGLQAEAPMMDPGNNGYAASSAGSNGVATSAPVSSGTTIDSSTGVPIESPGYSATDGSPFYRSRPQ